MSPIYLTSHVRGGGSGVNAWAARITGLDSEREFSREFLFKEENLSRSRRSGTIHFEITAPGIYQFGKLQPPASEGSIGRLRNGFFMVDAGGNRTDLTRAEVRAHFGGASQ